MSTVLSPDQEAVLAAAVSQGMFANTQDALDSAVRLLQERLEIENALLKGLNSGEPVHADKAFWEANRAEILRLHESRQT